jgi:hypothetical protein
MTIRSATFAFMAIVTFAAISLSPAGAAPNGGKHGGRYERST